MSNDPSERRLIAYLPNPLPVDDFHAVVGAICEKFPNATLGASNHHGTPVFAPGKEPSGVRGTISMGIDHSREAKMKQRDFHATEASRLSQEIDGPTAGSDAQNSFTANAIIEFFPEAISPDNGGPGEIAARLIGQLHTLNGEINEAKVRPVLVERLRQIRDLGYSRATETTSDPTELLMAGACYLYSAFKRIADAENVIPDMVEDVIAGCAVIEWPSEWDRTFKPDENSPYRDIVRGAALAVAALEWIGDPTDLSPRTKEELSRLLRVSRAASEKDDPADWGKFRHQFGQTSAAAQWCLDLLDVLHAEGMPQNFAWGIADEFLEEKFNAGKTPAEAADEWLTQELHGHTLAHVLNSGKIPGAHRDELKVEGLAPKNSDDSKE